MMTRNVLLDMELEEDDDEDGDIGEWGALGVLARKPEPTRGEVQACARAPQSSGRLAGTSGRGGGNP